MNRHPRILTAIDALLTALVVALVLGMQFASAVQSGGFARCLHRLRLC